MHHSIINQRNIRFKKLIGVMGFLGLMSLPAFALAETQVVTPSAPSTKKVMHHKIHHVVVVQHPVVVHHVVVHHYVVHHVVPAQLVVNDYKNMNALLVQPATEVCSISQNAMIMDQTTQSIGRSMPGPCNPGWFNRIQISGGINIDGKFGNRDAGLMGENYQLISLNDAYLNIGAVVNDWTKAFASISYQNATINDPIFALTNTAHFAEYSAAYSDNVRTGATNTIQLEQGYVTIGNFDVSPIYLQVGKQFQDFSRYEIHPITYSLTQVLSETLATSAKVGFIADGLSGSVYAFSNPLNKFGHGTDQANYGASLGFEQPSDLIGWDAGAGYLYNLIGANAVAYNVSQYNLSILDGEGYHRNVGGVALYADANSGPFTVGLRYTSALKKFNVDDLPRNGVASLTEDSFGDVALVTDAKGAKPWAAGVLAAYGYEVWTKTQNIYLGYQLSRQAAALGLPKSRWVAGYGIDVLKNTSAGIEWDHDIAYVVRHGGSGDVTNLVSVRLAAEFA